MRAGLIVRQGTPAAAALGLGGPQVVAQRGAERRLEARRHGHSVQQRARFAGIARQQLAQRLRLGPQRRGLARRRSRSRARLGLLGLRCGPLRLRRAQRRFGRRRGVARRFHRLGRRAQRRLALSDGLGQRPRLALGLFEIGGGAADVALGFLHAAGRSLMARRQAGRVAGQPVERLFLGLDALGRRLRRIERDAQRVVVPFLRGAQLLRLGVERGHGAVGVAGQRLLPLHVDRKLPSPRLQPGKIGLGLTGPLVQLLPLDDVALKDRGGDGVFLAQGGQGLLRRLRGERRLGGRALRPRGALRGLGQPRLGALPLGLRLAPAQPQEQTLGPAQAFRVFAVLRRLPRLPREARQLLVQRLQHVGDAGQVVFRGAQLQLRLVAALVEPADPRGVFKDRAACLGLGVDELGYAPLPHQRRRVRARRRVGEEHAHVAGSRILAVDLVGAAGVPLDAPRDVELVVLVELRRGVEGGVVDAERHLRPGPGGAGGGPREDHVLHPLAAHRLGRGLAHHPAQSFEQVGLAAAVGPHDARETRRDHQLRRVDEALKALKTQSREQHGAGPDPESDESASRPAGG